MTATVPTPRLSPTTSQANFAEGTLVRIEHNGGLYKISRPAAWSDTDPSTPTHYDVAGPSGRIHRMVPAERLIFHSYPHGASTHSFQKFDVIIGNSEARVKLTHCWRCATEISLLTNKVCPKCEGLKCKCGGCRCNWPYASRSAGRVIDVAF